MLFPGKFVANPGSRVEQSGGLFDSIQSEATLIRRTPLVLFSRLFQKSRALAGQAIAGRAGKPDHTRRARQDGKS